MKRSIASLASLCFAAILSVTLASGIAQACLSAITGTDYGGTAALGCRLTDSDANYCYYDCLCTGSARGCKSVAAELGIELDSQF